MREEKNDEKTNVGEMKKRREKMADGRRYIIYYTFEKAEEMPEKKEEKENV